MATTGTDRVVDYDLEEDFFTFAKLRRCELLFRGLSGEVLMAKIETEKQLTVVVKTFWLNDPATRKTNDRQFTREVKILKAVNHNHVMKCAVAARCPDYAAYVMPYYSRGCLLDTPVKLEPRLALRYTLQVAMALEHLHRHHIAHNDVKMDNVMLDRSDRVMLADFGHSIEVKESGLARARRVGGTMVYWSPEKRAAQDLHWLDPYKADIYALGVMYWLLRSKEIPSESTDYLDRAMTCSLDLTDDERSVLKQLLQPDPAMRPTASQACKMLQMS